ncbi:MAG: hypothetical protein ABSG78_00815 [Verrucomicrobiota bacterium]|jgi:hypothetical protein
MRRRAHLCLSILGVLMSFTSLAATAAQAPPETAPQREARCDVKFTQDEAGIGLSMPGDQHDKTDTIIELTIERR